MERDFFSYLEDGVVQKCVVSHCRVPEIEEGLKQF